MNEIYKVVTGDEPRIYAYELDTKQQTILWVFADELRHQFGLKKTAKVNVICFDHIAQIKACIDGHKKPSESLNWWPQEAISTNCDSAIQQ